MPRITKKPAERKQELIDAAERLFLKKGYELTAVSDIVKSIPVAQGTFYYYFDSKRDMLEAVLEKNFSALEKELASINDQTGVDPCDKFNRMINCMFRFDRGKRKLTDAAHLEGNTYLHHKLEEMSHTKLIPHLGAVVKEGVDQGRFNVPHPEETADVLFHALLHLLHEPALLADKARRKRTGVVLEHFFQSVLGIDDHRIKIVL